MISSNSACLWKVQSFARILLAGCLFCTDGLGQAIRSEVQTISGTVKDGGGHGLPNASIVLSSTDSRSINLKAATDRKGYYSIVGVALGHYSIAASAEGFRTSRAVVIDVTSRTTRVDFALKPQLKVDALEAFGADNANDSKRHPPSFQFAGIQGTTAPSGYSAGVTAEENAQVMGSVRGLAGQVQISRVPEGQIPNCEEARELLNGSGQGQGTAEANRQLGAFYLAHGELNRSIPYLEAAARLEPNSYPNSHNLAIAYLRAGRPSDAIPILHKLSKEKPGDAELILLLAEAYLDSGDSQRAVEAFREAARLDFSERIQFASGIGLIEAGLPGEAAAIFANASIVNPSSARLSMGLGIAQSLQQKNDQAIHSLLRAIELDPANLSAYSFLANLSGQSDETDEKIRERLETLVAANPESPDAHYDYALGMWKELRGGRGAQANEEIETQLKLVVAENPDFAEAHLLLGIVYADAGDFLSAVPELERATRLEPDNAKAHYQLSQAYRHSSQIDKANAEMNRFLALNGHADESEIISADSDLLTRTRTRVVNPAVPCDLTEK